MSGDARLKSYIDRILRCREAEDAAKQDTKAVYAELAADGYEKAVVGQVVAYLRKREKDGDKLEEQSAKFDLYLSAYESPSHAYARVRDVETQERPSTNDEASPEAGPQAEASPAGTGTGTLADREGRHDGEAVSAGLPTTSPETAAETQHPVSRTADAHAQKGGGDSTVSVARTEAAAVTDRRDDRLNHQSEDGAFVEVKGHARLADATGVEPSSSEFNPMEIARPQPKSARDYRPNCLRPAACAASGLSHCYACRKAMAESEEFA